MSPSFSSIPTPAGGYVTCDETLREDNALVHTYDFGDRELVVTLTNPPSLVVRGKGGKTPQFRAAVRAPDGEGGSQLIELRGVTELTIPVA